MGKYKLTDEIVSYIHNQHPNEFKHLSVSNIARHFHISICHISRIFKESQGINLQEWLLREKITRSKFLLIQDRRQTVKEVGQIMGFCSSDYFIKVFKNQVGVTPGKFREIDGGFYGLEDRRKGPIERRRGLSNRRTQNDRRKNKFRCRLNAMAFFSRKIDRRQNSCDRRDGCPDRRQHFPA